MRRTSIIQQQSAQIYSSFLDRLMQPMLNQVRVVVDSVKTTEPKEAIYVPLMIVNIAKECQLQIESICLQILAATVRIMLSGDLPSKMTISMSKRPMKDQLVKLIMAAKDHFKTRQSPSLKNILKATNVPLPYDEEGFSDDEPVKEQTKEQLQISLNNQTKEETVAELRDLHHKIIAHEATIQELHQKIIVREENLNYLTVAYLKDLQAIREQMQRHNQDGSFEFFEVSYFDSTLILDETTRNLLNQRIGSLKDQYERFAQSMMNKLVKFQQQVQTPSYEPQVTTYESQVAKVLSMDQNPYRLWKCIQDLKGPSYLLDVVTNQKLGVGISYKDINRIIQKFKPEERELLNYRDELQASVLETCKEVKRENDQLRQERANQRIQVQEIQLESVLQQKDFERLLNQKFQESTRQLEAQLSGVIDSENMMQLKRSLMTKSLHCEKLELELQSLKLKHERQSLQLNRLQLENQDLTETYGNSKTEIQCLLTRLKFLKQNLKAIVYQVDYRMKNIKSMEDINLTKEKNELVKAFMQKLKSTDQPLTISLAQQLDFHNNTSAILDAHELTKIRKVEHATQTIIIAVLDDPVTLDRPIQVSPQTPLVEVTSLPIPANKSSEIPGFNNVSPPNPQPPVAIAKQMKSSQTQTEEIEYRFPDQSPQSQPQSRKPSNRRISTTQNMPQSIDRMRSQSANDATVTTPATRTSRKFKTRMERFKALRDIAESFDSNRWSELILVANVIRQSAEADPTNSKLGTPDKSTTPEVVALPLQPPAAAQFTRQPAFFRQQAQRSRFREPNFAKFVNLEFLREMSQDNYRENARQAYERHMRRLVGQPDIDDLMIAYAEPKLNLRYKDYRSYKSTRTEKTRISNFTNVFLPVHFK